VVTNSLQSLSAVLPKNAYRVLLAATFGNALETFDGLMYGFLAVIVAKVFFPRADQTASLLLTLGAFGIGFVIRPIGAVVLGFYGDRYGRRAALTLTIWLMVIGTAMIGFAPSYQTAGLLSPVIVVIARLLQGLGNSGEYGAAVAMLTESAPPERRAFFASFQMCSTWVGITFAGAIGYFGATHLDTSQLTDWGWRVPFIIGLLLGPVGYYLRKYVDEPLDHAIATSQSIRERFRDLFVTNLPKFLCAMGLCSVGLSTYYLIFNYMPTFAVKELGLPLDAPFLCTIIAGTIIMVFAPIFGRIVDACKSPYLIYSTSLIIVAIAVLPLFRWVIANPSLLNLLIVVLALGVPLAAMNTLIVILASHIFPTRSRAAGLGASWNFSSVIFGGFAPFLASYTISVTGDKAAPAYYMIGTAIIALISAYALRLIACDHASDVKLDSSVDASTMRSATSN
jgi:MHS family proline/betaine transporter-like MFS transporter